LADTLNKYIDRRPWVTGTSQPMDRAGLLMLLETVLQANDPYYRDGCTESRAGAVQRTGALSLRGRPIEAGYQARVIQLRFIAAEEMAKILQPLFSALNAVRVDQSRNLLILAGNSVELTRADELIGLFDVDSLRGMSTTSHCNTWMPTIAGELRGALAAEGEDGTATC
jgi:general secretion pathway protein D